jgi:uncharacterized protein (DUF2384 family)
VRTDVAGAAGDKDFVCVGHNSGLKIAECGNKYVFLCRQKDMFGKNVVILPLSEGKILYLGMGTLEQRKLESIPSGIDSDAILRIVHKSDNPAENKIYFSILKMITDEDDKRISNWLDMTEKTYRTYRNEDKAIKSSLLEHTLMIISLFKHGVEIFGSADQFKKWLFTGNFHFDSKPPIDFIDTISGIRFIDNRLTGIEYGDNA